MKLLKFNLTVILSIILLSQCTKFKNEIILVSDLQSKLNLGFKQLEQIDSATLASYYNNITEKINFIQSVNYKYTTRKTFTRLSNIYYSNNNINKVITKNHELKMAFQNKIKDLDNLKTDLKNNLYKKTEIDSFITLETQDVQKLFNLSIKYSKYQDNYLNNYKKYSNLCDSICEKLNKIGLRKVN